MLKKLSQRRLQGWENELKERTANVPPRFCIAMCNAECDYGDKLADYLSVIIGS